MVLEELLGSFHSIGARVSFLRTIYRPGNVEVADTLLELSPDNNTLNLEANYAKANGDVDRFRQIARRSVDYHIREKTHYLLSDKVNEWNDKTVADYALSIFEDSEDEQILKSVVEIAQHFGQEEKSRRALEKILEIQLRDARLPYATARTCISLGRFDQAVDLFLKSGYCNYDDALKIAQQHVPARVEEVASRGIREYSEKYHAQDVFLACARVMGEERTVKKKLRKEAKGLVPDSPPRFYKSLVEVLMRLDLEGDARKVVQKVAKYQEKLKREGRRFYFQDEQKELAKLYEDIGEFRVAGDILLERVDIALQNNWHPSNFKNDIDKGYELTQDPVFLERKLILLEMSNDFEGASKVATLLGNEELAKNYLTMQQMIKESNA
jgi:tetratricopeptide (TPR) repeat protein